MKALNVLWQLFAQALFGSISFVRCHFSVEDSWLFFLAASVSLSAEAVCIVCLAIVMFMNLKNLHFGMGLEA